MDLAVNQQLAIGNGIITVENEAQAIARSKVDQKNKGGFAASAVIRMIKIRAELNKSS